METTFHNVTITIEAPSPKAAYDRLCNEMLGPHDGVEWETDEYQVGDVTGSTEELFPEDV